MSSPLKIVRVTEKDPSLHKELPLIGIEQGLSHETRLPDKPAHFPAIADNFRQAMRHVEIWRTETPAVACGAVFLSPLAKGGERGLQIDDIVVMPDYRRRGIGSALIQFVAALAKSRGLSFIAWECEEHNPARHVYRKIGATPRDHVKPFRLGRDTILQAIAEHDANHDDAPPVSKNVTFNMSDRFSLFRTLNHGIDGYDMDPTQKSLGLQVEDLAFDTVRNARHALTALLKKQREQRGIDFVDLVVPFDDPAYRELIASFDAAQNTYSGNPAFLWELRGGAFDRAAESGTPFLTARSN